MVRPSLFSCKPEILNECIDEERVYLFPTHSVPIALRNHILSSVQFYSGNLSHLTSTAIEHRMQRASIFELRSHSLWPYGAAVQVPHRDYGVNFEPGLPATATANVTVPSSSMVFHDQAALRRVMIPVSDVTLDLNEHVNSMPARTQLALSCNEA